MSEAAQITFMQVRLLRLATEEWVTSLDKVVEIFKTYNVFSYIETGYGIFSCEGDGAVLEDIERFLDRKGLKVHAGVV